MTFFDILYGAIEIPDWLMPFIKAPEFLRLRGVRLSNVDSFQFKDFNAPTRWEHSIAVAYLAIKYCEYKRLSDHDRIHLILAALLHDIATPPFAHTLEYVLNTYDHEVESFTLLTHNDSENIKTSQPIFAYQLPQLNRIAESASNKIGIQINLEEIADIINGGTKLGGLLNGKIDLDNIDNVTRASLFLGGDIDKTTPLRLVKWLAENGTVVDECESSPNNAVQQWLSYRSEMYKKFYYSDDEEIGRQAFLQHLMRRAIASGTNITSIIFTTDESLLNLIENIHDNNNLYPINIRDLVTSYRLLENPHKIIEIPIEDEDVFDVINNPSFSNWLEQELTTKHFEPFIFIKKRRYQEKNTLFPPPIGTVSIYKLHNSTLKRNHLPNWLRDVISYDVNDDKGLPIKIISDALTLKIHNWVKIKPWNEMNTRKEKNILTNLENIKNWNFKNSRNEGLHIYPATFVHSIPSTLINALELKGELILDPFGGTGQTAMEAIKHGCKAITSDINSIANLIAKTKFSYLSRNSIDSLQQIDSSTIKSYPIDFKPKIDNINKWHNDKTINELSRIRSFIFSQKNKDLKNFLLLCFSDIITSTTERKGKDFAYFADNTPLPRDIDTPTYVNAIDLFLLKIKRNIEVTKRQYSFLEKKGCNVKEIFKNVSIYQNNIVASKIEDFNLKPGQVGAIITSPPYLCMIDYTYGNRLSYYWIYPDRLEDDFQQEIGSRRTRTKPQKAVEQYLSDMRVFAKNSKLLLKKNGYLATVLGSPLAKNFVDLDIINQVYQIFEEEGLDRFWDSSRDIQWVRSHGISRLKNERIAVHIKK